MKQFIKLQHYWISKKYQTVADNSAEEAEKDEVADNPAEEDEVANNPAEETEENEVADNLAEEAEEASRGKYQSQWQFVLEGEEQWKVWWNTRWF